MFYFSVHNIDKFFILAAGCHLDMDFAVLISARHFLRVSGIF